MTTTERPPDLPCFDRPPVSEVVLGVQFTTDVPLRVPHLGLYWQTIREDFPDFSEQPPLSTQIEALEPHQQPFGLPFGIQIGTGPMPAPRCWFMDSPGNRLIQLQSDWFLHNWRKVTGDEEYPHFEDIRDQFIARWQSFAVYASDQGLGTPVVTQAEVTYVNHIPQGGCWKEADDLPGVFSILKHVDDKAMFGPMEAVELVVRRRLPGNRGRLHVSAAPAMQMKDNALVVRMVLTARGPVGESSSGAILEWMQMGRAEIVKSFTALTTAQAHEFWKRTH